MEKKFAGVTVLTKADGSDRGIDEVLAGSADIAAVSRSLTPEEEANGLASVPIVRDSIAIVIGTSNPFSGSLSSQQVKDIFTGQIMKWSEVGGAPTEIRVINRPPVSGTYKTFQQEVLQDAPFGTGSNFTTLARDATTPMLQALKLNGIGYATYTQVAGQRTVRALAIDGISPSDPNYPFQRTLYYVYKEPASGAARAFLGFATSADGQEAIARSNEDLQK
jgi:phosphate transport system substrate-binding protein